MTPDGTELVEIGTMRGRLAAAASGENGFGYDPIFVADGQTVSNAGLTPEAKNAISHRALAFRALAPHVASAG